NMHNEWNNQLNMYGQYDQKLKDHRLSITAQFTNNTTKEFQDISTFKETVKNQFTNNEESTTRVFSVQVDDSFKKDKISWDNGVKFGTVSSIFQLDFADDDDDGSLTYNPLKSNGFIYNEQNYAAYRSEEHTFELQSRENLVCRLL